MKSPITGGAVKKQLHHETIAFRGESLSVPYINYLCEDSGTEFTTKEADRLNLAMLHHVYLFCWMKEKVPASPQEEILMPLNTLTLMKSRPSHS